MTQSHPRPLGIKKWKKRMGHLNFHQVYYTVLFFHGATEQSLNAYGIPPSLCNSKNSWKIHIIWTTNDREKIRDTMRIRERMCRQLCRHMCSARICGCAVCLGWLLLGTLAPGRVGVSRSTLMAQRAMIWSLLQGEMRACVRPEFLQLGLLLAE